MRTLFSGSKDHGTPWNRRINVIVRMNDFERDYWMGTEIGQLGGHGFQRATLGVDGSCKDGKMGSGCCKFQGGEADKCA
jgi:hypothetical protein